MADTKVMTKTMGGNDYTPSQMEILDNFIKDMAQGTMEYDNIRDLFQQRLEDNGVKDVAKRMKVFDNKHLLDEKATDLAIQAAMFDEDYRLQWERRKRAGLRYKRAKANGEKALAKKLKEEYERETKLLKTSRYNRDYAKKEYYNVANKDSYLAKRGLGDAEGVQRLATQSVKGITNTMIFSLFCPQMAAVYGACMVAGLGVLAIVNIFAKHKRNVRNATLETYKDFVRELCRDRNIDTELENDLINEGKKEIDEEFHKIAPESIALQAANNERRQRDSAEEAEEVKIIPIEIRDGYYNDLDNLEKLALAREEIDRRFAQRREEMKRKFEEELKNINGDKNLSEVQKNELKAKLNKSYSEGLQKLNGEYNDILRKLDEEYGVSDIGKRDNDRSRDRYALEHRPSKAKDGSTSIQKSMN